MLGDFTDDMMLAKKAFMDILIWGATIVPLLNVVQERMNNAMPSRKKKKNKIAPEIE